MLQVPHMTDSAASPMSASASASPSENNATSQASTQNNSSHKHKLRSCVVCRTRKVRCDKLSPCSNCRRANIACVSPSTDRPPRWARRLERVANNAASKAQSMQEPDPAAAQVMDRLRYLESLVMDLSNQLKQANDASNSVTGGSSGVNSPEFASQDHDINLQNNSLSTPSTGNVQKHFGRMVLQDANKSRYVSSGFWSRVKDELDELQMDSHGLETGESDTSEDEASPGKSSSTQELTRTPSERHAFLFGHNLSPAAPDLREFHPLPSQIPFLLDIFSENVNSLSRIVHVPTVAKMVRNLRGSDMTNLTPANQALMFSIYYAAITSMEEDDILTNFGFTKSHLNLKYRLGLEHALAKADFLNVPDLTLVQAFAIFLCLVRRHDSPRFVWMMVGLLIRMGQALGLHRDGTDFEHLSPYEIEMRRRAWWTLCMLDVRASEDQGTEYTIARGSFNTKLPLNINDADIEPTTTQMPTARVGITDMTFSLVSCEMSEVTKQMMAQIAKEGASGIEEQDRLLNEIYQKLDRGYLQYSVESGDIAYWVGVTITRLVMAKMTLFIYLPILFSSPSEHFLVTIRDKLLVAAIETAEYNHALNAEQACRHWRWVFQTYTHWYAIVYLLIEISRRQWSPIVERAWVALHSQWLIPAQSHMDKNLRIWVPLRRLTANARQHRDSEVARLRSDAQAAERLEMEDQMLPIPASPGPFAAGSDAVEVFRERWRKLLYMPTGPAHEKWILGQSGPGSTNSSAHSTFITQPSTSSLSANNLGASGVKTAFEPSYLSANRLQGSKKPPSTTSGLQLGTMANAPSESAMESTGGLSDDHTVPDVPATWSMSPGLVPWLWADGDPSGDIFTNADATDVNMNLDGEVDWYNWVESAKGMEWNAGPVGNGRA